MINREDTPMTPDFTHAHWFKSLACSAEGCVEIAHLPGGQVALRDSKDVSRAAHVFDRGEWDAFLSGVKNGESALRASCLPEQPRRPLSPEKVTASLICRRRADQGGRSIV